MSLTTMEQAIGPDIGLYRDMPAADYHAIRLPSNSLLSKLNRSPLQAYAAMNNPKVPTPEMEFGTALHSLILEPTKFAETYTRAGACCAIKKTDNTACTNAGVMRSSGLWYCGVHCKGLAADRDLTVLPGDDWVKLQAMKAAIDSHPVASALLKLPGENEVSAVFRDPQTEVVAKMRADRLVKGQRIRCVLDIKTTRDACPTEFPSSIYRLGYYKQAAMYLRGLASLGEVFDAFVIIACEKEPPFDLCVYKIIDQALEAGDQEVTRLLKLFDECERSGKWPGYSNKIIDVSLPPWAWKQLEIQDED